MVDFSRRSKGEPPPLDVVGEMVVSGVELLGRAMQLHDAICDRGDDCPEKANTLAFLAHCLDVSQRDLDELPRRLEGYRTDRDIATDPTLRQP